jgi:hypothetical protein
MFDQALNSHFATTEANNEAAATVPDQRAAHG